MPSLAATAIVLRFRDLVTEAGGTIAEHRRILRQREYVWWGWWRRQAEHIPRTTLGELFTSDGPGRVSVILFDSGTLELCSTYASQVVVAPTNLGIHTPEFDATPDYYVRGNYSTWFRLVEEIIPLRRSTLPIVGKPTTSLNEDRLPVETMVTEMTLESLRDDRPTLWLARPPDTVD